MGMRSEELSIRNAERKLRELSEEALIRMIREDCEEATRNGLLTKSQVVDIARRELAQWESE